MQATSAANEQKVIDYGAIGCNRLGANPGWVGLQVSQPNPRAVPLHFFEIGLFER